MSCLSSVGTILGALTKEMPRFEEYLAYFPLHERLRLRLVDVYQVFIAFCARALRFLMTNKLSMCQSREPPGLLFPDVLGMLHDRTHPSR
jgi:hypothetical protein